jgi:hypothetical protein
MTDLILGNPIGELSKKRARGLSFFGFKTAVIANRSLPESEFFLPLHSATLFANRLRFRLTLRCFLLAWGALRAGESVALMRKNRNGKPHYRVPKDINAKPHFKSVGRRYQQRNADPPFPHHPERGLFRTAQKAMLWWRQNLSTS